MATTSRKITWIVLGLLVLAGIASAEVERIEITSRSVFAEGMEFGEVGPYEKIRGTLFYAVDPDNAANAAIVDLDLAPRGADGKVRFQGDFILLKPVDLAKGNGRLLYDVNNRGNLYMLRHINEGNRHQRPIIGGGRGQRLSDAAGLLAAVVGVELGRARRRQPTADRAAHRHQRRADHPTAHRGRDRQQLRPDGAGLDAAGVGQQPLLSGPRRS